MLKRVKKFLKEFTKRSLNTSNLGSFQSWINFLNNGVSKDNALKTHAAVYAAVNRKSNSIAQLPLKMYCKSKGKRKEIDDYRAELVNIRPEVNRSAFVFWRTIEAMKEIYGNAYAYIERDIQGQIIQLKLLDPRIVAPFENEEDNNELYYLVTTTKGNVAVHHLDMLHFTSVYSNGYVGISFIDSIAIQLNLNKTTQETAKSQAENSLKVGGVVKLGSSLADDKKKSYKEQFEQMYSKGWNSILVLDSNSDYTPLNFSVQDLKVLENNKVTIQQVSMVSCVPLYMLGEMDGAKYNNVEQQNIDFVQSCIAPDVVQIEQELNYKLLSQSERNKGLYFKFNLNALLRADMNSRANYYQKIVPLGGLTVNEMRALEDYEDVGALGDRPLTTLNLTFLDTLENHERIKDTSKGGETDGKQGESARDGTKNSNNKES